MKYIQNVINDQLKVIVAGIGIIIGLAIHENIKRTRLEKQLKENKKKLVDKNK